MTVQIPAETPFYRPDGSARVYAGVPATLALDLTTLQEEGPPIPVNTAGRVYEQRILDGQGTVLLTITGVNGAAGRVTFHFTPEHSATLLPPGDVVARDLTHQIGELTGDGFQALLMAPWAIRRLRRGMPATVLQLQAGADVVVVRYEGAPGPTLLETYIASGDLAEDADEADLLALLRAPVLSSGEAALTAIATARGQAVTAVQQQQATSVQAVGAAAATAVDQAIPTALAQQIAASAAGPDGALYVATQAGMTAIGGAVTTGVGQVNTAGATKVGEVNTAGATKVGEVNAAGAAQVVVVEGEGDTQAQRLEDAATAHLADLNSVTGEVHPDTATGLAATTEGETFQAMDGGQRKLFLHAAGPVATALFVYPALGDVEGLFTATRTDALTVTSVVDSAGDQIAGLAPDGRAFLSDALSRVRLETRRVGDHDQVFAVDHLGASQLTYTGNNYAPEWLLGGMIRFTSDRAGLAETWVMGPDGEGKRRVSGDVWEDWQVCGQSLGIGSNTSDNGSTGLALTTTNETPQAFMPEITGGVTPYGPRTHYDSVPANLNLALDVAKITGLTPLVEALYSSFGETVCSGFAAQYMRGAASDQRMVISTHGRGAAPWLAADGTYIAPGSAHFANGQLISLLVKKFVEAGGAWGDPGEYRRGGLIDMHGQNDATAAVGTTFEQFVQYQIDKVTAYNRHGRADSFSHRQRRMYSQQIASFVATYVNTYSIARAQAEAGMRDRRIVPFSSYEFLHGDQVHMRAVSQRGWGEKVGMWARRLEREGKDREPFLAHRITLIGTTAYCEFKVPTPPIQIRTDLAVAAIANAGIVYADDEVSGITVTGVPTVYDNEVLAVPLSSGSIGTNARLKFASAPTTINTTGPLTGARTNICDSETERGVLSGDLLTDWALIWEKEISL